MKQQLKIKLKNTYWQTHKIIEAEPDYEKPYFNPKISKQKNILRKYGNLENFYKNT